MPETKLVTNCWKGWKKSEIAVDTLSQVVGSMDGALDTIGVDGTPVSTGTCGSVGVTDVCGTEVTMTPSCSKVMSGVVPSNMARKSSMAE